jgi:hypothetical protein
MKNHTKVYLKAFGYTTTDFIACEVCGHPPHRAERYGRE